MLSQRNKPLSHNIWNFYVYKGAWGLSLGLIVSILVLYYLDLNISLAGFMTLMAIIALTKLVMEVPGGIIADKFSRKWRVCTGASFNISSILMMVYPYCLAVSRQTKGVDMTHDASQLCG